MSEDKHPLDHAVEIAVYAPIGFALEAKRLLPSFIERGRQQVTMAKVVGQFAVTHGKRTATAQLGKVQDQAEALLSEFGLVPSAAEESGADATDPVVGVGAAAPAEPEPPVVRSGAGAADLPIADYDSLAASQVIPRLDGLSPAEVAAVGDYERAHRGRKTILGKIAQITGE